MPTVDGNFRRDTPRTLTRADAGVPVAWAAAVGFCVFGFVLFGFLLLDRAIAHHAMFWTKLWLALAVGFLAAAAVIVAALLWMFRENWLNEAEEWTGVGQDGAAGREVITRTPVRISNNRLVYISLPATPEQLDTFFRRTLRDGRAAERRWKGHFIDVRGVDRIDEVWGQLKTTGLMVDGGSGQPLRLTALGYEYMRMQTGQPPYPTASARVGGVGGVREIPPEVGEWEE